MPQPKHWNKANSSTRPAFRRAIDSATILPMRILVTGGAGFVGSHLALSLAASRSGATVTAFDNLKRRGSELALERLRQGGVGFVHGDIRNPADFDEAGAFDLLLECSAEPSVHAGYGGSPRYLIDTNLGGTVHCLEAARQHGAGVVFLSTSRVYPIAGVRDLPLETKGERLVLPAGATGTGWSEHGIAEDFPMGGSRSMYGATKLASELLVEEYCAMYDMPAVINRCGVLTGPWQMGKVDQGFFVLWAARHLYGGKLGYSGFGGLGHQVRDLLHVADLHSLVERQIDRLDSHRGEIFNVGGGKDGSVSLAELTGYCHDRIDGSKLEMSSDPDTKPADIPWYVSDSRRVAKAYDWAPQYSVTDTLDDVLTWLKDHRAVLEPILSR